MNFRKFFLVYVRVKWKKGLERINIHKVVLKMHFPCQYFLPGHKAYQNEKQIEFRALKRRNDLFDS